MIRDPAFWSLVFGFGRDEDGNVDGGCIFILAGLALVALTTAVKVLG